MAQLRQRMAAGQEETDPNGPGGNVPGIGPGVDAGTNPGLPPEAPNGPIDPQGRSGEGPRDRIQTVLPGGGGGPNPISGSPVQVAPRRPSEPTPMAGSVSGGVAGAPEGLIPFSPLGDATPSALASPGASLRSPGGMGNLFGAMGGLKGGGLGVPMGPDAATNQPIDKLIQMLMQGQGGR